MPSPSPADIEVYVVMPCLDEAETIGVCIDKAKTAFDALGVTGEVVVGDNGSTDGSQDVATAHGARVVAVTERGYGAALMGGIEAARGRFIVMGDSDDSYDFSETGAFVTALRDGADLAMGCRLPSGGGRIAPGAMPWLHRWVGTPVLTLLCRLLFDSRIHDVNCGMRGFTRRAFEKLDLQTTGMEFASEMVIKAALLGMTVKEVPISFHRDGRSRPAHLRTWRDGWRHLRFMLLFSPAYLFVLPGALLFLFGAGAMVALSGGPLQVGGVTFAINSHFVAAMCLLIGFQLITLGISARSFATSEGLMPPSQRSQIASALMHLEWGLVVGACIIAFGVALLACSVARWAQLDFGPIESAGVGHLVVTGVTACLLGLQIVSAAFFGGVLALKRKGHREPQWR